MFCVLVYVLSCVFAMVCSVLFVVFFVLMGVALYFVLCFKFFCFLVFCVFRCIIFSWGTRAQHLTLSVCVMCVCVVSPGRMRCSDLSKRQLYSHSQCVQYMCTHNIVINRSGILA